MKGHSKYLKKEAPTEGIRSLIFWRWRLKTQKYLSQFSKVERWGWEVAINIESNLEVWQISG